MSTSMAAALFGISTANAGRWLSGETKPSRTTRQHLRALQALTPRQLLRLARIGFTINKAIQGDRTTRPKRRRRRRAR